MRIPVCRYLAGYIVADVIFFLLVLTVLPLVALPSPSQYTTFNFLLLYTTSSCLPFPVSFHIHPRFLECLFSFIFPTCLTLPASAPSHRSEKRQGKNRRGIVVPRHRLVPWITANVGGMIKICKRCRSVLFGDFLLLDLMCLLTSSASRSFQNISSMLRWYGKGGDEIWDGDKWCR